MLRRSLTRSLLLPLCIFAVSGISGAQSFTASVLYNFCTSTFSACEDGDRPEAALVQGADGNYYGLTAEGGTGKGGYCESSSGSCGVAFKLAPDGTLTTIYNFCSLDNCTDGSLPFTSSSLIQGGDGNFYGVTIQGGAHLGDGSKCSAYGCGTIFMLTPGGILTTLHAFCAGAKCSDGVTPLGLIQGSDGTFYGVTNGGGANSGGTAFNITPTGTFTTLYNFCSDGDSPDCLDGDGPSSILQGSDGNFYGTAEAGGSNSAVCDGTGFICGTVFKLTASGAFSTLYNFCSVVDANGYCTDGNFPATSLVEGADSNYYGTTYSGGTESSACAPFGATCGTVFKLTAAGKLTTLYSFCDPSTCTRASSGLMVASDNNFYDIAADGTFFQISQAGSFTSLAQFGISATSALLQDSDGRLDGMTMYGGSCTGNSEGCGIVFDITDAAPLAPPVQLSLSSPGIVLGGTTTLNWQALNAFSLTMQQCYLFSTFNGQISALGKLTGMSTNTIFAGSLTLTPLEAGVYPLAVTCGGVESGFATLTVTPPSSTTALSANAVIVGQPVTLKATVTSLKGIPSGVVNFLFAGAILGSAGLSNGVASLTVPTSALPSGSYPIIAEYAGSGAFAASSSPAVAVVLTKARTSTTLSATPDPVTPPGSLSFTATVKRASGGTGVATGSVTFYVGTFMLGTVPLNSSGAATLALSTAGVAAGSYQATAAYAGDAGDVPSSSGPATIQVN